VVSLLTFVCDTTDTDSGLTRISSLKNGTKRKKTAKCKIILKIASMALLACYLALDQGHGIEMHR
jgi:hypothetical protein